MAGERGRELGRCVITAPIGMKNCLRGNRVVPDGHIDRSADQRSLAIIFHGPSDYRFGVVVDDGSHYAESGLSALPGSA
jgi:hypothetical protein